MNDKEINLKLTVQEANLALQGLGVSIERIGALIQKIQNQAQEQLKANDAGV